MGLRFGVRSQSEQPEAANREQLKTPIRKQLEATVRELETPNRKQLEATVRELETTRKATRGRSKRARDPYREQLKTAISNPRVAIYQ